MLLFTTVLHTQAVVEQEKPTLLGFPYTICFCQPQAHDTAQEIGASDKAGVGCKRSKTLQKEHKSLVAVAVLLH